MITSRMLTRSMVLIIAGCAADIAVGATADVENAGVAQSYPRNAEAGTRHEFLDSYCMECHNSSDWAGSLAFDLLDLGNAPENPEVWEKVVQKLQGGLMPPTGATLRPDLPSSETFVSWLTGSLDHAGNLASHVGHVGLHRLNRKEYANAIRDLLGIEVDAESLLPQDPTVDGFDNVAEVLRVSALFLDQSLTAARIVVEQAVGSVDVRAGGITYRAGNNGTQHSHVAALPLGTRGGFAVEHYFPADGEYQLNIADMARALWVSNQEFTHTLIATYDGVRIFETDIGGGDDLRAIDQMGDPAVDAINNRLKSIKFHAEAGPHEIAVTFVHRSFAEFEGTLHSTTPGGGQNIIRVDSFEIQGPFDPSGVSKTPARNTIFTCYPSGTQEEVACATQIIEAIGRKAFRRSITESEIQQLLTVYDEGYAISGFETGVRHALTAIIASPKFLYRYERMPMDAQPGSIHELTDLELASRLSFFLWSSIPDETLLDVAEAGQLKIPGNLETQVRRMLEDPRARVLASNFAYQWLNLAALDSIDPDPMFFADIDRGVRELFKEEILLFVEDIFFSNHSLVELLTSEYTFLNERLALHYDIQDVKGDTFRKVKIDRPERSGLLGKGGVLMVSSYPDRTSPVLRAKYFLEYISGTPLPDPPPNVEALVANSADQKQLTVRERMAVHRNNPSCSSCHGLIDPLGFAFENFDAVGRFRTIDRFVGSKIDATGVLPDGTPINGLNDLREHVLQRPELFVQNITSKLLLYALGRPIAALDMPTVRNIVRQAEFGEYKLYDVVMGIVASTQFRFKQAAEPEAQADMVAATVGL